MNRLTLLASGTAAVLVAGTAAAVASAGAATGAHTLTLHAKRLQQTNIGKSHEVETDVLMSGGKRVGYGTESCFFGGTGDVCSATFTLKNGVLYGHYTFPISDRSTTSAKGKITGGLATYTGAAGKIRINATAHRETIRLTY